MRVTSARALPAVKIAQGITGQFYASNDCSVLNDGTLNIPYITGAGFNALRHKVSSRDQADGVPFTNVGLELSRAVTAGLKFIYTISDVSGADVTSGTYQADVSGWNAYITAAVNYAVTNYGSASLPFIQWRNEPSAVFTAAQVGAEMAAIGPLIASLAPNALFTGPAILGFGGTQGRGTGTQSLAQYISNGGLGAPGSNIMFDFHLYDGGVSSTPENRYAQEGLWLSLTALQARPDLQIAMSECGYQTNSSGGNYYATPANQGKYVARLYLIYRAHWHCRFCSYYENRGDAFGLLNSNHSEKPGYQTAKDSISRVTTWVDAASYSRGITPIPAPHAGEGYGQIIYCPWFVRGTLANGDEELAVWHASLTTWPDQVVCYNPTGVAQTLSTKTCGGSTTTQTVPAGVSTVYVTLTDTPQIMYGTGLRWPEFQH